MDYKIENRIEVLDYGLVRLVDHMGDDLSIVRAARTSYDAAWRAGEDEGSDAKLINYLWKNKHSTPFEAVEFQFEVKAPIFILRQWHRHRTWSYNELSGRYRPLPEEFYVPAPENIGSQSKSNKQGRDPSVPDFPAANLIRMSCQASFKEYNDLLESGVPKEIARMVLPVATYSHMFAKTNLRNLLHFISLRDHSHAQWEMQQYAKALLELIKPIVPVTIAAWESE